MPHEGGDRGAIDARLPAGMGTQRLQLGAEQEQPAELCPVQRLDAEPIANERQRAVAAVPHRDREHADQPLDRRLDAERGEGFQHHLGVGMAAKANAARLEFGAQLVVIVDLAVVDDDEAAVGGDHRLVAGRREIDNGKPPVRKRDPGFGVDPDAVIVGAAMREAVIHCARVTLKLSARRGCRVQYACNAAHRDDLGV